MDEHIGTVCPTTEPINGIFLSQSTIDELLSGAFAKPTPLIGEQLETLTRDIKSQDLKTFVVKGVIKCRNSQDIKAVLEVFNLFFAASGHGNTHRFFLACGHDQPGWEHVHYWHDCNYLGNWCKCSIFKRFKDEAGPCIITNGKNGRRYRKSIDSKEVRDPGSDYVSNVLK